jgi:hypothetical protein
MFLVEMKEQRSTITDRSPSLIPGRNMLPMEVTTIHERMKKRGLSRMRWTAALVMDHPPDLINAALETLIKDRYELPAFSTLDRLAGEVRTQIQGAGNPQAYTPYCYPYFPVC